MPAFVVGGACRCATLTKASKGSRSRADVLVCGELVDGCVSGVRGD